MIEAIAFEDAEAAIVEWLAARYATHSPDTVVATAVPRKRPALFTRIMRTGGPKASLVTDAPQITVESFGDSETAASGLARLNRALIGSLPGQYAGGVFVYRVEEMSGPGNLPDPSTNQHRYSQTFVISMRGHAL